MTRSRNVIIVCPYRFKHHGRKTCTTNLLNLETAVLIVASAASLDQPSHPLKRATGRKNLGYYHARTITSKYVAKRNIYIPWSSASERFSSSFSAFSGKDSSTGSSIAATRFFGAFFIPGSVIKSAVLIIRDELPLL